MSSRREARPALTLPHPAADVAVVDKQQDPAPEAPRPSTQPRATRRPAAAATTAAPKVEEGRVALNIRIPVPLRQRLRQATYESGVSIQDLCVEAIDGALSKRGI
jgi:hypothetical protein